MNKRDTHDIPYSGTLVVVSGFSGVGKGTLVNRLTEKYPGYAVSVSATTRSPREGEKDGISYHFVSKERFSRMIEEDDLIEYAEYVGNYYGTPRRFVESSLKEGKKVILEIDVQGGKNIRSRYPDAVMIFIMPPSVEELMRRLSERGSESADVIRSRLERAREEASYIEEYDYVFINDDLEECAGRMHSLIDAQKSRTGRNTRFIDDIREQLEEM